MTEIGRDIPAEEPLPENRFTTPTEICPHPDRWTSTDGDSTEREVAEMIGGLIRGLQPDAVLETGTGFAEVALFIAQALDANDRGRLYTVEFDEDRVEYARRRLSWASDLVNVIQGDSRLWTPPDGVVFDFCWFDSWYPNRVPEFHHYRPHMRIGTIVGFHDTAPGHGVQHFPGSDIRTAIVRELRSEIRMIHLPTPRGLTLGEVFR